MRTGFVYVLKMEPGPYKIGWSTDPERRFKEVRHWAPEPMSLVGFVAGTEQDEMAVHTALANHNTRGEWFKDCPEVAAFVVRLVGGLDVSSLPRGKRLPSRGRVSHSPERRAEIGRLAKARYSERVA